MFRHFVRVYIFALAVCFAPETFGQTLKVAGELVVLLDSADPSAGEETWHNFGTLGNFERHGQPQKRLREGVSVVSFQGQDAYKGPVAPSSLVASQTRSIELWVWNQDVADEDTMVAWGRRGEIGRNMAFNFGRNPGWGGAGHWGMDIGWKDPPPSNRWCHLVYTYDGKTCRLYFNGGLITTTEKSLDTHPQGTINISAQNDATGALSVFSSLEIALVRIHSEVLSQRDILANFELDATRFGARSWLLEQELQLQDPGLQARVNQAVDKGVAQLTKVQELDGSWRQHIDGYGCGMTALSVYTLLKSGLSKDHPSVRRGIGFILSHPPVKTYSMSCAILCLVALDAETHREFVGDLVQKVIKAQLSGGFAYPEGQPDLSNTQYAALALRAAAKSGHSVPNSMWTKLATEVLRYQAPDGPKEAIEGFRYSGSVAGFKYRSGDLPTGSMTAAGLSVLAISEEFIRGPSKSRTAKDSALRWLAKNFTVKANPSDKGNESTANLHYYIYGLERVGAFMQMPLIGTHDWYREGATFLVNQQGTDGAWQDQANTCFSLLFLTRGSNAPVTGTEHRLVRKNAYGVDDPRESVSLRAAGTGKMTFWVSSFGDEVKRNFAKGERRTLPVASVSYFLEIDGEYEIVAHLEGDPNDSGADQRFAAKYEFTEPGTYKVFARVMLETPDGKTEEFDSSLLEMTPTEIADPMQLRYAEDGRFNLISQRGVEITTSSETHPDQRFNLVDNLLATVWRADPKDTQPKITIQIPKKARADSLLLSHPFVPGSTSEAEPATVQKVRVRFNKKEFIEVEMNPNPTRKTEVALGKPVSVGLIEIEIIEWNRSKVPGLAEIELQDRK